MSKRKQNEEKTVTRNLPAFVLQTSTATGNAILRGMYYDTRRKQERRNTANITI